MHSSRIDSPSVTTITLTGEVADGDVQRLRSEFLDALDDGRRDLLVDAHRVTALADLAPGALVGARSRAKFLRHRVAVLDAADGVTATSLRRSGLIFRIPVYPDQEAATAAIESVRAGVRRRLIRREPQPVTSAAGPRP